MEEILRATLYGVFITEVVGVRLLVIMTTLTITTVRMGPIIFKRIFAYALPQLLSYLGPFVQELLGFLVR